MCRTYVAAPAKLEDRIVLIIVVVITITGKPVG